MSDYENMTKDELIAEAQEQGISPANASMTKAELVEALEAGPQEEEEPEAGLRVTTTSTKDYLGVALVNPTPGTSQATDRLGRSVVTGNKDFLARNLVP